MALLKRARGPVSGARCLATLIVVLAAAPGGAGGQVFLTQEEALELAFGSDATLERRTAYLTDEELARVRHLAGDEGEDVRQVVTHYVATRDGRPVGVAYFDIHRVRTLPEVLMIAVGPGGRVSRIEVLKFSEPPEYLAADGWLEQFPGRSLDGELSLKGDIVTMTGATLTSLAVTGAVRRALALHEVLRPLR